MNKSGETSTPELKVPEGKGTHKGGGQALAKAFGGFLVLGLLWLAYWLVFQRPFVSTDDAYVVGNQIRVSPRTSGSVQEILADNTALVEAGAVLVRLDRTDAALALERAKADLAQAVRQIHSQMAERDRLEALVTAREGDLALIEGEYNRRRNLRPGSSVTAEEVERYRQQFLVAVANQGAARHELMAKERLLGQGGLREHPQIILAIQRLREAFLDLDRCQVRSPAAGQVARRTVQVGTSVSPSSSLMAVVPLDEVWVEANFKESQLGKIKPGHKATISSDMYGGSVTYGGVVMGLSAGTGSVFSLLPAENATGNWIKVVQRVPVKIMIDPEDLARNPLLLGLSLKVEVNVAEEPGPASSQGQATSLRALWGDQG
ncbi:MAG: efflux RND transporter periplasmic adaptor subunit, partial [Deltaproteobacteria bacterium]|nr:efflux RND transporter periplasmic adaptor subunit [Deltaproteobacteria bacterium]